MPAVTLAQSTMIARVHILPAHRAVGEGPGFIEADYVNRCAALQDLWKHQLQAVFFEPLAGHNADEQHEARESGGCSKGEGIQHSTCHLQPGLSASPSFEHVGNEQADLQREGKQVEPEHVLHSSG